MTGRDLQRATGDENKPREIGKRFDRSAPIAQQRGAAAQLRWRVNAPAGVRLNTNVRAGVEPPGPTSR